VLCVVYLKFPVVEQGASNVGVCPLPNQALCSDSNRAASAKSSLYADSSSFSRSHHATYQTDSPASDESHDLHCRNNSTDQCRQSDAGN